MGQHKESETCSFARDRSGGQLSREDRPAEAARGVVRLRGDDANLRVGGVGAGLRRCFNLAAERLWRGARSSAKGDIDIDLRNVGARSCKAVFAA